MPDPTKARPILFSAPMVNAILAGQKTMTRRVVTPRPEHKQIHKYKGKTLYEDEHRMWCWQHLVLENIWDFPMNQDRTALAACCPYGRPGDRLWVREGLIRPDGDPWLYAADRTPVMVDKADESAMVAWAHHKQQAYCPSMFMPRFSSRILLEIMNVRVEQLHEITESDAESEGIPVGQRAALPSSLSNLQLCTHRLCIYCGQSKKQHLGSSLACFGRSTIYDPTTYAGGFAFLWNHINATRKGGIYSWDRDPFVWVLGFRLTETRR